MIRSNFFNDPLITEKYEENQRYLLIGLACAADDYGKFWWNSKNLKSIIYPLDSRQPKWIEKNLELFHKDEILCKYQVKNITYGHFPLWFDKSFILKQRLDHPKPEQFPDCNIHQMNEKNTRTLRETSPPSKVNITELNKNKESVDTDTLSISLIEEMKSKYPDKDVDAIVDKVIAYYQGKNVPLDVKVKDWCESERVENKGFRKAWCHRKCPDVIRSWHQEGTTLTSFYPGGTRPHAPPCHPYNFPTSTLGNCSGFDLAWPGIVVQIHYLSHKAWLVEVLRPFVSQKKSSC